MYRRCYLIEENRVIPQCCSHGGGMDGCVCSQSSSWRTCCHYKCCPDENHSPNNGITMWPCSDMYRHSLRAHQSERTKHSHTHWERHCFPSEPQHGYTANSHTQEHRLRKVTQRQSGTTLIQGYMKKRGKNGSYIFRYAQTKL